MKPTHSAETRRALRELRARGYEITQATDGYEAVPDPRAMTETELCTLVEDTGLAGLRFAHPDGRRVSLTIIAGNGPGEAVADGSWSQSPDAEADCWAALDAAARDAR